MSVPNAKNVIIFPSQSVVASGEITGLRAGKYSKAYFFLDCTIFNDDVGSPAVVLKLHIEDPATGDFIEYETLTTFAAETSIPDLFILPTNKTPTTVNSFLPTRFKITYELTDMVDITFSIGAQYML